MPMGPAGCPDLGGQSVRRCWDAQGDAQGDAHLVLGLSSLTMCKSRHGHVAGRQHSPNPLRTTAGSRRGVEKRLEQRHSHLPQTSCFSPQKGRDSVPESQLVSLQAVRHVSKSKPSSGFKSISCPTWCWVLSIPALLHQHPANPNAPSHGGEPLRKHPQPSSLQGQQIPFGKLLGTRRTEQPLTDTSLVPFDDLQRAFSFYCLLRFNSPDFKLLWLMINSRSVTLLSFFGPSYPLLLYVFIKERSRKTDSRLKGKQIEMGQMYLA